MYVSNACEMIDRGKNCTILITDFMIITITIYIPKIPTMSSTARIIITTLRITYTIVIPSILKNMTMNLKKLFCFWCIEHLNEKNDDGNKKISLSTSRWSPIFAKLIPVNR